MLLQGAGAIERVTTQGLDIFLIGSLISLAIALGVGYRLSCVVVPPVRSLTEAAEALSTENTDVRVTEQFTGEFGILARAFNSMARRIKEAVTQNSLLLSTVRESREKFRNLYDQAPDEYHSVGEDGLFQEINLTELG